MPLGADLRAGHLGQPTGFMRCGEGTYPFHTCGGLEPDGLDVLVPMVDASMAELGDLEELFNAVRDPDG